MLRCGGPLFGSRSRDASGELGQARDRARDFAHGILASHFAGNGKKLAADRLHLAHAQPQPRELASQPHEAAAKHAHQAATTPARMGSSEISGAGNAGQDLVHIGGRCLFLEKGQHNARRLFSNGGFEPGGGGYAADQILHEKRLSFLPIYSLARDC